MPCSLVKCEHTQQSNVLPLSWQIMELAGYSEMLVHIYKTTQYHITVMRTSNLTSQKMSEIQAFREISVM